VPKPFPSQLGNADNRLQLRCGVDEVDLAHRYEFVAGSHAPLLRRHRTRNNPRRLLFLVDLRRVVERRRREEGAARGDELVKRDPLH